MFLEDGPCMGSYTAQRAPAAMRATRRVSDGSRYVLDLVDDVVDPDELAYLYRRQPGVGFACGGRGRAHSCTQTVTYSFVGALDPVTGEVTEPSERDREWWAEQRMLALSAWALGEPHEPRDPPGLVTVAQGALFA